MAITFCLQSLGVVHTHTLRADYLIVISLIEFRPYVFFWTMPSFWFIRFSLCMTHLIVVQTMLESRKLWCSDSYVGGEWLYAGGVQLYVEEHGYMTQWL